MHDNFLTFSTGLGGDGWSVSAERHVRFVEKRFASFLLELRR